ncbi:styrene monooxygenase/indole monooxygenase family protein [Actinoplanes sp. ATCC 53533]|uniref:styrene monooxygenase/indole monooxygenase family protein n=1 Tax=Actinoplanes sp. ATCC 53533 TaxID=1288362 RepID=UPI0013157DA6|nr:styrene monooxygenase/indole monooxygenase family protein [Actinoplanes sp. ATCC 53533]
MRKILIVGAGQAGLQLALSLLTHGYEVAVVSATTPEQIRAGRPQGIPALFAPALATERGYRLNLFGTATPPLYGARVTVAGPSGWPVLAFNAELERPGRCTDLRVKTAAWLELAEQRGATVIYQQVTAQDLDVITADGGFDLAIVAAGCGDLTNVFGTDPVRTVHDRPQRVVAGAYVQGLRPDPHWADTHLEFHTVPGIGELLVVPAVSLSGPCHALAFEALPGGPADQWPGAAIDPEKILDLIVDLVHTFTPWVAERVRQVRLGDPNGAVYGRVHPRVRHPVAHLPSGGIAMGLGDALIVNDPVGGQGANLAAKAAAFTVGAILAHGMQPFGEAWMNATFEAFWSSHGAAATTLTNTLLSPPAPHMMELFAVSAGNPQVAARFAAGLADPADMTWFTHPDAAASYLATVTKDHQPDKLAGPRGGDRVWPLNARRRPRPGLRQLPTSRRSRP